MFGSIFPFLNFSSAPAISPISSNMQKLGQMGMGLMQRGAPSGGVQQVAAPPPPQQRGGIAVPQFGAAPPGLQELIARLHGTRLGGRF